MHDSDKGKGWRAPVQQASQPQPVEGAPEHASPRRAVETDSHVRLQEHDEIGREDNKAVEEDKKEQVPDDARFSAGIVGLYTALLKEPIPEEMLRLVRQLDGLESSGDSGREKELSGEQGAPQEAHDNSKGRK